MPLRTGQFLAIAGLAIKELLRQPVCLLLALTASALTILLPQAIAHQMGQQISLARDSALAFQLVFGVMLAGYAAGSTLYSECVSGTALTVFSRPVGRETFFLAKLAAVAVLLGLFVWISIAGAMIAGCLAPHYFETDVSGLISATLVFPLALGCAAFLNFKWNYSFPASAFLITPIFLSIAALVVGSHDHAGNRLAFASRLDWRLVSAGIMGGLALLLLASIALTIATRMKPAPTIALLTVIFSAGLISDYLVTTSSCLPPLSFSLRALLPNIQAFWMADDLAGGGAIPGHTIWGGIAYAAAYITGTASLGILLFRQRDF